MTLACPPTEEEIRKARLKRKPPPHPAINQVRGGGGVGGCPSHPSSPLSDPTLQTARDRAHPPEPRWKEAALGPRNLGRRAESLPRHAGLRIPVPRPT